MESMLQIFMAIVRSLWTLRWCGTNYWLSSSLWEKLSLASCSKHTTVSTIIWLIRGRTFADGVWIHQFIITVTVKCRCQTLDSEVGEPLSDGGAGKTSLRSAELPRYPAGRRPWDLRNRGSLGTGGPCNSRNRHWRSLLGTPSAALQLFFTTVGRETLCASPSNQFWHCDRQDCIHIMLNLVPTP